MKFCPECGEKLGEGVKFCMECGARVPVEEAPVPPVEEPPVDTPPVMERPKAKKKPRWLLWAILGAVVVVVLVLLLGGGKSGAVYTSGQDQIELKPNGKAILRIKDMEFDAKWEQKGDVLLLEQGGDTYVGALEDDVLVLELAGTEYVFTKAAELSDAVTYKAVSCISHGQVLDEALMDSIGGCYVRFLGDGSGVFYCFGERAPMTYDKTSIMIEGESMAYTVEKDTLTLEYADGSVFTMEPTQEDPERAAAVENGWETEEREVNEEVLNCLDWPGLSLGELNPKPEDVTLEISGSGYSGTVRFHEGEDGTPAVESVHLYLHDGDYDSLKAVLTERYGEPTDEGEEPYAEANGGAVTYCWFNHPYGALRLSSASERDYMEIIVSPG